MTREEAAQILMARCMVNCFLAETHMMPEDQIEAMKAGATALRRLDELERWAQAWDEWEPPPMPYVDTGAIWRQEAWRKSFKVFLKALNGEMSWPEGEMDG